MRFGPIPLADAQGAILAHSVDLPDGRLRKGLWLTAEHLARLAAAGHAQVTVAALDPGDVPEDIAAGRIAAALVPDPDAAGLRVTTAFTGRVNLIAARPGVCIIDTAAVHGLNRIDPMITLATLPPLHQVAPGQMVATVKIIAYAVAAAALACAETAAPAALRIAPVMLTRATLIVTEIPGGAGLAGVAAIATRLAALGIALVTVTAVPHQTDPLARAIRDAAGDLVLILTGSATSDPADVAPMALRQAGGQVIRFGMPVDPGNLLFLGLQGGRDVIGLPGCARSPALNGADWVLARIACGIAVTDDDIAAMGLGGLLKEIPTRPMPRRGTRKPATPD
jgi:molybdenum cofactor cytidylyltransferase